MKLSTRLRGWRARWLLSRGELASQSQLVIFNYHCITPRYDPTLYGRGCWTSTEQFMAELEMLRRYFSILPLDEAIEQYRNGTLEGRVAAITLDDGDISLQQYTAKILQRMNIPATFFINSAYLGKPEQDWVSLLRLAETGQLGEVDRDLIMRSKQLRKTTDANFYRDTTAELEEVLLPRTVERQPRYVDYEFLQSLSSRLHVGMHGHHHERYAMFSEAQQLEDLKNNLEALKSLPTFRPLYAVAFGRPHDWNAATRAVSEKLGLTMLLADGGFNFVGASQPGIPLNRIPSDGGSVLEILDRQWQKKRWRESRG